MEGDDALDVLLHEFLLLQSRLLQQRHYGRDASLPARPRPSSLRAISLVGHHRLRRGLLLAESLPGRHREGNQQGTDIHLARKRTHLRQRSALVPLVVLCHLRPHAFHRAGPLSSLDSPALSGRRLLALQARQPLVVLPRQRLLWHILLLHGEGLAPCSRPDDEASCPLRQRPALRGLRLCQHLPAWRVRNENERLGRTVLECAAHHAPLLAWHLGHPALVADAPGARHQLYRRAQHGLLRDALPDNPQLRIRQHPARASLSGEHPRPCHHHDRSFRALLPGRSLRGTRAVAERETASPPIRGLRRTPLSSERGRG